MGSRQLGTPENENTEEAEIVSDTEKLPTETERNVTLWGTQRNVRQNALAVIFLLPVTPSTLHLHPDKRRQPTSTQFDARNRTFLLRPEVLPRTGSTHL